MTCGAPDETGTALTMPVVVVAAATVVGVAADFALLEQPVSKNPSTSAKMICEEEVRDEIYGLVGVKVTQPLKGTWADHVYSCKYVYPNGSMTLSVKELADKSETDAYFASLAQKLGKV